MIEIYSDDIDGVLFDLDGTLVDNMAIHADAFGRFSAAHDLLPWTEELARELDGKRNRDILPILFRRDLSEDEIRRFAAEKEGLYRNSSKGRLSVMPGVVAFLDALENASLPFGIATSAPADNVMHSLTEIAMTARFTSITRSDEVARGKPWPDVFLEGARKLGAKPERCLAFEDAPAGIRAAQAAGMRVIAVATTFTADVLRAGGFDGDVITTFDELVLRRRDARTPAEERPS